MSAAPLDAIERIHAEVEKERPLQPHPVRLIGARQNLRGFFGDDGSGITVGNYLHRGIRDRRGRGGTGVRERLPAGQSHEHEKTCRQHLIGRGVFPTVETIH